ncbi:hypothetical protein pb186bvf_006349 [Paramecium bursaria]
MGQQLYEEILEYYYNSNGNTKYIYDRLTSKYGNCWNIVISDSPFEIDQILSRFVHFRTIKHFVYVGYMESRIKYYQVQTDRNNIQLLKK